MTDLAPVLVRCTLCRHPLAEQINKRIVAHGIAETARWMESLDMGAVPHRNTFSTHKNEHMTSEHERAKAQAVTAMRKQQTLVKGKAGDLAQLVRDNVFARVEAGDLEPSMSDGLRAQEMLDRRNEKQGDRELMVQLAGLLSGATVPVALLNDGSIEGEYREMDDERGEDEAAFTALLTG